MPDIRDLLPQPPWEGPPIPRGGGKFDAHREEESIYETIREINRLHLGIGGSLARLKEAEVLTEGDADALREPRYDATQALATYEVKLRHVIGEAVRRFGVAKTPPQLRPYMFQPRRSPGRRAPTKRRPTRNEVRVEVWEERDRLHIGIQDKETGDYIISWWDEEAREMFSQGFFKRGRGLEESVLSYAEEQGFLTRGSVG